MRSIIRQSLLASTFLIGTAMALSAETVVVVPLDATGSAVIGTTLDGEMPTASAMVERLQWVALGGVSCTVLAITLRRVSRGSGGTREGRVLSRLRPSVPSSR